MDSVIKFGELLIFLYASQKLYFLNEESKNFIFSIFLELDIASSIFSISNFVINEYKTLDKL